MSDDLNETTEDLLTATAILRRAALSDSWDDLTGDFPEVVYNLLHADDSGCCEECRELIDREIAPRITAIVGLMAVRFLKRSVPPELINEFFDLQEQQILDTEAMIREAEQ